MSDNLRRFEDVNCRLLVEAEHAQARITDLEALLREALVMQREVRNPHVLVGVMASWADRAARALKEKP